MDSGPIVSRFVDVRWFAEVDSTNRIAAELARAGAPDGLVVGADHQTAGRGRRGRTWESRPGGSLLVSVVLRPVPPLVTLAAGVAAAEACAAVGVPARLKWPNDVMGDGGKLGGILSELVGDAVVVGLGLNLAWAPPGAACLGAGVDPDVLLGAWLAALDGLDAPGDVLARYRRLCSTLGRQVRVEMPGGATEGVAEDVDEAGRLVVDGRPMSAGDVVHLRPAD